MRFLRWQRGINKNVFLFFLGFCIICLSGDSFSQDPNFIPPKLDLKQKELPKSAVAGERSLLSTGSPNLITQALALTGIALLPFVLMLLTSFIKIVIVLSLLRNALGAQQAPPNQVINGVALLLTVYIMYPTGVLMYEAARPVIDRESWPDELGSEATAQYVVKFVDRAKEPFRDFVIRNSDPKHHKSFYQIAYKLLPEEYRDNLHVHDFIILIPSFVTGQLKSAFEIGVLIYIPFFVIDLVTSNILLAMGMMMLSPVTISMPLKLLLLVMLDGWTLLVQGLVGTFK